MLRPLQFTTDPNFIAHLDYLNIKRRNRKVTRFFLFRELEPDLKRMSQEGKIDVGIASKIELIEKNLSESASKWAESRRVSELDAFAMYHALRISLTIAEWLRKRILTSKDTNDNPLVVDQALELLPLLSQVEESVKNFYGKRITPGTRQALHYKVRVLRDQADDLGMYPSFEEETRGIDKEKLKKQVERVASTLAENA